MGALDLPPPSIKRWTPTRKLAVIRAVQTGSLSVEEVLNRWPDLSVEELASWQQRLAAFGVRGLRTVHLQTYPRKGRNS
jgi:hypothetical protein